MNLENIISVTGKPGLYQMINNKNSGLILQDIHTGNKRFYSAIRHQFTPLASITIFTMMDSEPLEKVFQNMLDQFEDNPPPAAKSSKDVLYEYFEDVLPQFDKTKVMPGDIKKIIKWFVFLKNNGIFDQNEEE